MPCASAIIPASIRFIFGLLGETIEMTVRASNRDCYAQGAFAAAKFLFGKPAGLDGMKDALGVERQVKTEKWPSEGETEK